jgi:hypothetical protein
MIRAWLSADAAVVRTEPSSQREPGSGVTKIGLHKGTVTRLEAYVLACGMFSSVIQRCLHRFIPVAEYCC